MAPATNSTAGIDTEVIIKVSIVNAPHIATIESLSL
jgi:hypothetical protein